MDDVLKYCKNLCKTSQLNKFEEAMENYFETYTIKEY